MPESHASYPESFRTDAVALVRRGGRSIAEVAVDLGISGESLCIWVQQAQFDAGEGLTSALTTEEGEELRRLRRENMTPPMERETLREAAAFVAYVTL